MKTLDNTSLADYKHVRAFSSDLCRPLSPEDHVIQSTPEASPTKWHLAHTTWFYENFILKYLPGYKPFHTQYNYLFNSYYNSAGVRHCRAKRGQLSRPTVDEITLYRAHVDKYMEDLFECAAHSKDLLRLLELGINHEQQHQELILTDIKHVFACNPLHPVYSPLAENVQGLVPPLQWINVDEGIYAIGHSGYGFGYDNEFPCHQVFLNAFKAANRLVTNGEYLEFINDQGYRRPEWWLSDGWDAVCSQEWVAPLYWEKIEGQWFNMTLNGFLPVNGNAPVCHVSFYEADAYARWSGRRLLTEAEWEIITESEQPVKGNFVESRLFHPSAINGKDNGGARQLFGDVWEWTSSPYVGYPGYRPAKGALGEYNGKFMSNQMVLRGGSCASPQSHLRTTYRNFFAPHLRWQFSGLRLGDDR